MKRLLIIGFDGATFDVLNPMMEAGRMPRLKAAVEAGASGLLRSTTPALTPAAWTSFLTGQQPGVHGVIDFEQYDVRTNGFRFNSARSYQHVQTLWQILGDHGLRIGSINVPLTYPASPVPGFLVSGFETPGPEADFVYPKQLKEDILRRWPDPTFGKNWEKRFLGGARLLQRNVDYISRSFHQGAEMARWLGDVRGWDVLMVVLKLVDNLQHKTWRYLDPWWPDRHPRRRRIVAQAFEQLDAAAATLLDYAALHDAAVLFVSDHGHGSLEGKVHPNALLRRWGYLQLRKNAASDGQSEGQAHIGDVERPLPVDFERTTACVMHAGNAGFLYINLKGRQPTGIVDPGDNERVRDELIERFGGGECCVLNPAGDPIKLFPEVHKAEDLYGCTRADQPWLPDLILIPHETLAVVRRLRGNTVVKWFPHRRIEGTHRPDGIFIATGPGVKRHTGLRAHIIDCAPTILALLGLPIPAEMTGRVITEIFEQPPSVERAARGAIGLRAPVAVVAGEPQSETVYTREQLQRVTDRLSDLGYLE